MGAQKVRKSLAFVSRQLALAFVFHSSILAAEQNISEYQSHLVKKNEILSEILLENHLRPLYCPTGSVAKTIALNPETISRGGDLILPDTNIFLPIRKKTQKLKKLATHSRSLKRLPASEETLTQASAVSSPAEFQPSSDLQLSALGGYSALIGTDPSNNSTGKLLSKLNTGVAIGWNQNWTPQTFSHLVLEVERVDFEPEQHGLPLYSASQVMTRFGGGVGYHATSRLTTDLIFLYGGEPFYRGYLGGGPGLELNVVPILEARPSLGYVLLNKKPLSLTGVAALSYYAPSSFDNYTINNGWGWITALKVSHSFRENQFDCKAGYGERYQNTSLITLVEKKINLECGYRWHLSE